MRIFDVLYVFRKKNQRKKTYNWRESAILYVINEKRKRIHTYNEREFAVLYVIIEKRKRIQTYNERKFAILYVSPEKNHAGTPVTAARPPLLYNQRADRDIARVSKKPKGVKMSEFKPKKFGCGRYIQEPDAYQCLAREV